MKIITKEEASQLTILDFNELTRNESKTIIEDYMGQSDFELSQTIIENRVFAKKSSRSNELLTIAYWELNSRVDYKYYHLLGMEVTDV